VRCYLRAMRLRHVAPVVAFSCALAACGSMFSPTISGINARPDKYYEHKVTFTGRIQRTQYLAHETLLELADTHGGRIIVRSAEPVEAETGDWVKVEGVLVAEAHVDEAVLYDVVTAERIGRTRAPRFIDLM